MAIKIVIVLDLITQKCIQTSLIIGKLFETTNVKNEVKNVKLSMIVESKYNTVFMVILEQFL